MNMQDVRDMYEYNDWANHRLLEMAEKITPVQFIAPSSHSFSSLQATLVHTLDTERVWRFLLQVQDFRSASPTITVFDETGWAGWLQRQGFPPELQTTDVPTVSALRQRWQEEEAAMWAYLSGLRNEDLGSMVRYYVDTSVLRERLLWHCLFHVVNHGMQHRSEAAALLTDYGQSPGGIDFTVFLNERKARQDQQG